MSCYVILMREEVAVGSVIQMTNDALQLEKGVST